jgi:hypothetical protein
MASFKEDVTLKYQVTKDGDVEKVTFRAGDTCEIVQRWDNAPFVLFKDGDGHYYNVAADKVED